MAAAARLRLVRAPQDVGDILPGDFVTLITGNRPGHREILPLSILMRVQQ